MWSLRFLQFNEVTPKHHSIGSIRENGETISFSEQRSLRERFVDNSSAGQIILYLAKTYRRTVCRIPGEYKVHRIFFARIVGHDYICET